MKLRDDFDKLEEMILLSAGSGVNEIWSRLSDDGRIVHLSADLGRLDILACNVKPPNDQFSQCLRTYYQAANLIASTGVRKSAFDLMFLSSLPTNVARDRETFVDLTEQVDGAVPCFPENID